jgi:sialate O-acetylesterase
MGCLRSVKYGVPAERLQQCAIERWREKIAAATHPTLRLLLEKRAASVVALSENESTWTLCTPETAKNFSAVAYFFGREILEREHVPIGLIDASWGGTPAHSWISPQGIAYENLMSVYEDAGNIARDQGRADEIGSLYA